MAYASAEGGGGYGVDASIIHFDPAHADHIRVPDAELLFRGEYQRLGPDLVVTGPDGRHHIIPGYFSSEKHPALVAPNGASLTPDVIDLLAGSPTPGQYAQAQPTTPPDGIGKVEKVIGSVTVVRNGVAVALHVGDAVYKSDVVQTGANSSVGIGFPDGTALNLVANTRMALNDYSFDASGTSNSALFTLVEGTFAFVAGKVAHDGNMKVATPVATMGIRGTTVYFAVVTSSLGEVQYLAQLFADYQTGHVGAVEWFDNNPASPTYGQLIDIITDTGYAHYFTPRLGQSPLVNVQPATNFQNDVINGLSHLIDLINNSQSTTPNFGSPTLPDIDVPHLIQQNGGNNPGPFTFINLVPGLTAPTFITVALIETTTQILTSLPSSHQTQSNPLPPPSGTFVWTSSESGPWNTGGNWNSGNVPGQTNNVEIDQLVAGKPLTVTVADSEAAKNLVIGPGVVLHIGSGGSLTVANGLDDFGLIQVGGDPPKLSVVGPVTVEIGGAIEAFGEGTQIQLSNVTLSNLGTIEAANLATITIDLNGDSTNSGTIEGSDGGAITLNGHGHGFTNQFLIEAFGEGTQIKLSNVTLSNLGTIDAEALATITISLNGDSTNAGVIEGFNGGVITLNGNGHGFTNQILIEAFGEGTQIQLSNITLSNLGTIEAEALATITIGLNGDSTNAGVIEAINDGAIPLNEGGHGGTISIVGGVTNLAGASIEALGAAATLSLSNGALDNQGGARIEAGERGSIALDSETVTNESGAKIEAKDLGTITFDVGSVTNDGKIEAKHFGSITLEGSVFVQNNSNATIEATKYGGITLDGGNGSDGASGENDGGTILAKDHGAIAFENIGFTNQDGGIIEAQDAGTIIIEGAEDGPGGPAIFNDGGTIAAIGLGSTVQIIQNATVHGGSFDVEGGALFVDSTSNLTGSVNVSIGAGGFADLGSTVNAKGADLSVAFTGMGTLELDQPPAAPITVTGFGIGDVFDLTNVSPGCVSLSLSGGSLTITEFETTSVLTLAGDYSVNDFRLETDAFGGTEVFFGNDVWTNTAGGNWNDEESWSDGAPACSTDAVIGVSGTYTVTITDGSNRVNSLAITDAAATLTGSGHLSVITTLDNAGIIDATGCDVLCIRTDTLINEYSGVIAALDGGNLTVTDGTDSTNYGLIKAANGGSLTITHEGTATNEHGATIEAVNNGDVILNNNESDANYGLVKAAGDGSTITINVAQSDDISGGNFGKMEAVDGGNFSIVGDMSNASTGTMKAIGEGSQFKFSNADYDGDPTLVGNAGTILAADHGAVTFCGVGVGNQDGAAIVATDYGTVEFKFGSVDNAANATIVAQNLGTVTFDDVNFNGGLTNLGTVEALGWGSLVSIEHSTVTGGTLTADGGTLSIGDGTTLSNVTVAITGGGIAEFGDALVQGVTFTGAGTLALDQTPGEGAAATGFGANDVLDLTYVDVPLGCLSLSWLQDGGSGTLKITQGGDTQATITLDGTYNQSNFALLSDPTGGTEVVYGVQQIWTGSPSDQWNTAANWSNGVVPGATDTAIIDNVGHQPVTIGDAEQVANLVIDSHSTLEIAAGGALTVTNALDDAGTIDVNATGSDPTLVMYGPVRVEGGAEIDADGTFASVTFFYDEVGNAGNITAVDNGTVSFDHAAVFNQDGGVIEAKTLSTVTFDNATVTNQEGAAIEANGGQVVFDPTTVTNDGSIEATGGGTVAFADSTVANSDGSIQANPESVVKLAGSTIDGGEIGGEGTLEVAGSSTIKGCADVTVAQINVEDGNTLTLDHVSIDGSTINLGHAATGNAPSFTEISAPDVNAIGPSISADGEFVAFIASTNLPGQGDTENVAVELYDAATGKLTDISAAAPALPAGETSLGFSNVPSISGDGRYVVFDEKYEVPNNQGPPLQTSEVLLYDRESQTATVVQTFAGHAEISGDGQYIVMQGDTIPGNNNPIGESVLVTDRSGNVLTTIGGDPSFNNSNNFGDPNSVYEPAISGDGRFVTFWTTSKEISVADGSTTYNFNTGNTAEQNAEVYVYDRVNHSLQEVSGTLGGVQGNGDSGTTTLGNNQDSSWQSSLSADGRYVVFQSSADNLVAGVGDANHDVSNIFLYDTQTGTITAITDADSPSAVGNIRPEISADGTLVTFASDDLPGADGIAQTYSYDTQTQTIQLVSTPDGETPANAESDLASAVSANGSAIAFGSLADNLVIPTANDGSANIYLVAPGTLAVTGDSSIGGGATINDGTAIVEKGVTLTIGDATLNGTFVRVDAGATLHVEGADAVATFDGVEVSNEGTIQVDNVEQSATLIGTDGTTITGGTLSIGASGLVESQAGANALGLVLDDVTVWNCGTLEANGATLYVTSTSAVEGSGNVLITSDGLADFAGKFEQDVTFQGTGTLELGDSLACGGYAGLVSGFGAGDSVDLNDVSYTSGEYAVWTQVTCGADAGGTLQIYKTCDGEGVLEETLNVAGTYTQNEFYLADDGTGAHGTSVYSSAVSFNQGQTNFSDNSDVGYTGPQISVDGRTMTLVDGLHDEHGSWFSNNTHTITAFAASFDYQADGGGDGLAFIVQNDPRGAGALGTENGGSGLGYTGISPSAAVEFNFYSGHVQGTNFETNGTTQIYNPTGDVTLGNGDEIQVVLSYDGSVLTETLTDLTHGATYSTSYTGIDLSQIVGSDSAYIGFSAATGAATSTQSVSNFEFESGQAVHWVGADGADWTAADAWNDGNGNSVATPNVADNVFVDKQGAYTLTITTADTANLLTITAAGAGADIQDESGGSLTLNGSLTIDAGSFSLIGGALSAASIDVEANGHFIGYGCVAAPLDNDGGFVEAQQHLSLLAAVTGNGAFQIDNAAVLEFGDSVAGGTVTFGSESGTLKLDDPSGFNGVIAGISEGDVIGLAGFDVSTTTAGVGDYNSENNTTPLTVSDGEDHSVTLTLAGNLSDTSWAVESAPGGVAVFDPPAVDLVTTATGASGTITFADSNADTQTASFTPQGSDYIGTFTLDPLTKSNGAASLGFHFDLGSDQINVAPGQTLTQSYGINVTDAQNPAMKVSQTVAVTVGGPGNDNFVFKPGVGADTIVNFDSLHDTIELDHFANAQTVQQLESLITADAHGDAVIALGHNDSITVAGVNAAQLQQLAQAGHVIMH